MLNLVVVGAALVTAVYSWGQSKVLFAVLVLIAVISFFSWDIEQYISRSDAERKYSEEPVGKIYFQIKNDNLFVCFTNEGKIEVEYQAVLEPPLVIDWLMGATSKFDFGSPACDFVGNIDGLGMSVGQQISGKICVSSVHNNANYGCANIKVRMDSGKDRLTDISSLD